MLKRIKSFEISLIYLIMSCLLLVGFIPVIAEGEDILVIGISDSARSLEPAIDPKPMGRFYQKNIYEGLIGYRGSSTEILPRLATSWSISEDGLEYTFNIREGVSFHDGTKLDAHDVKYSFDRSIAIGEQVATFLSSVMSTEVLDDFTFKVTLNEPSGGFLYNLYWVQILSLETFKEHATDDDSWAVKWANTNAIGTGPYKLVVWEPLVKFEAVAFEEYWGGWKDNQIDRLLVQRIPENASRAMLFKEGELDVAFNLNTLDLESISEKPGKKLVTNDSLVTYTFIFNCARGVTADVRVRQAIAYSFPDEKMKLALEGWAGEAVGPIPVELLGHFAPDMIRYEYDLEKAADLLRQAGYPGGKGIPTLDLVYYTGFGEPYRLAAELLTEELKKIGIDINPIGMEWGAYLTLALDPDTAPPMGNTALFPKTPEPGEVILAYYGTEYVFGAGGGNGGFYSNLEVDELTKQALTITDQKERFEAYRQILKLIAEDCPKVPVYKRVEAIAMKDWVMGYEYNPARSDAWQIYEFYVEKQ